jgi:hypothetical protein
LSLGARYLFACLRQLLIEFVIADRMSKVSITDGNLSSDGTAICGFALPPYPLTQKRTAMLYDLGQ